MPLQKEISKTRKRLLALGDKTGADAVYTLLLDHGLSSVQRRVYDHCLWAGAVDVEKLVAELGMSPVHVRNTITKLVKLGLLTRARGSSGNKYHYGLPDD